MEKSNRFILGIAFLLCLVIILIGVFKINSLNKEVKQNETKNSEIQVDLDNVRDNYQEEISSIIKGYSFDLSRSTIDDFASREIIVQQTIDKVMDLTLTKEFKELHLEVIIALNSMQEGYEMLLAENLDGAQEKLDFGFSELERLKVEYPWLNN